MVVVITSTGGVTKRDLPLRRAGRPRPREWAGEYLNETRRRAPARNARSCAGASRTRAWRRASAPSSPRSAGVHGARLGGAAAVRRRCRRPARRGARGGARRVPEPVRARREARRAARGARRVALEPRRPFVRVGHELEHPALREIALVGAAYGLAHRALGAVSLARPGAHGLREGARLGPLRRVRAVALRRVDLRRR